MALFNKAQIDKIKQAAEKSNSALATPSKTSPRNINAELKEISDSVTKYFADSPAQLINTPESLHAYVTRCIEFGYAGIDTETTGLDRVHDTIVGVSLYYPGEPEIYIPSKHKIPIFEEPYKGQLSYSDIATELQRLVDNKVKLIFANADFDIAMVYKDMHVDLVDACFFDVILAWRCLKENEKDNSLKRLYNKYILKGKGDPKKFSDFFTPKLFPYCKPEVAKLYAANDAKITYDLCMWQLPYLTKTHAKCQKAHLEKIADLVWRVEFPMIKVCAMMHRDGIYLDKSRAEMIQQRYQSIYNAEMAKLRTMVQDTIDQHGGKLLNCPFANGNAFNPNSPVHVKYLCYNILNLTSPKGGQSTDKEVLKLFNTPVTAQILAVRSADKLLTGFVDKLPGMTTQDSRIHAQFKSVGADTGRMSSQSPNLQNVPSHANDIRHMFRATPAKDEYIDCVETETGATVSLPRYYNVKTPDGFKEAKDLLENDIVLINQDGVETTSTVLSVTSKSPEITLTLSC